MYSAKLRSQRNFTENVAMKKEKDYAGNVKKC